MDPPPQACTCIQNITPPWTGRVKRAAVCVQTPSACSRRLFSLKGEVSGFKAERPSRGLMQTPFKWKSTAGSREARVRRRDQKHPDQCVWLKCFTAAEFHRSSTNRAKNKTVTLRKYSCNGVSAGSHSNWTLLTSQQIQHRVELYCVSERRGLNVTFAQPLFNIVVTKKSYNYKEQWKCSTGF